MTHICRRTHNLYIKIGSICPSVCATVSASINPLPSDRVRCCDWYIRCQWSLAVRLLFNSLPVMSGCPSHRGSVRRVSRYQLTHVRYRTVAAGRAQWQLANWCMRGANWLSTTSLTATVWGCWTVDFDSHGQHYSEWLHKPQSHKARLWPVLLTGKVSKT